MATKASKSKAVTVPDKSKPHMVMIKKGDRNTAKYWATRINELWQKTAENYIEMGRLLNEARGVMVKSEWQKLLNEDLHFDETKAKKLMLVAKHPLALERNLKALPPAFTTLYTLTELDEKDVKRAISKGDIHPNMDGSDAKEIIEKYHPKEEVEDAEVIDEVEEADEAVADDETDDAEPEESEEPTKPKKEVIPRTSYEVAVDNLDGGIESLIAFLDNLEGVMEQKGNGSKLPNDLRKKLKRAHTMLAAWLANY